MHGDGLHQTHVAVAGTKGVLAVVRRHQEELGAVVAGGGLNVYPAEIEKALHGIAGLVDLAVIGVKDDRWGEVPMVVFHSERPAAEIVADIAEVAGENLATFKRPKHAVALGEPLPRTFSGKLAKPSLRQRFPEVPADALAVDGTVAPA